jgi:hypothetical protein
MKNLIVEDLIYNEAFQLMRSNAILLWLILIIPLILVKSMC